MQGRNSGKVTNRLSHQPLPVPRTMFLPLCLCNPVARNSFTIYMALYSLQSAFTNYATSLRSIARSSGVAVTCFSYYSIWLLLCDAASVACPLWAAVCPSWQKAIISPPHRPRSIWRGADGKWICQASTSSGILRHSRENPPAMLQDEKCRRIIIFPSTWLLIPKCFQKPGHFLASEPPAKPHFQKRRFRSS